MDYPPKDLCPRRSSVSPYLNGSCCPSMLCLRWQQQSPRLGRDWKLQWQAWQSIWAMSLGCSASFLWFWTDPAVEKASLSVHADCNWFWFLFTPRSIVLLSTRGEIKQLNISNALVPLGLAKPAHLYNKGLYYSVKFPWGQHCLILYGGI